MNKTTMNKTTNKNRLNGQNVRAKIMAFLIANEVTISHVSFAEIGDEIGQASTSVVKYHLGILEAEGMIERTKGKVRGIRVVK